MINPKIKICGISDIEILKQLINFNLDYVGFIFYYKNGGATSRGRRRRGSSGSRTPGSGALGSTSSTFGPLSFTSGCLLVDFPRNVMRNLYEDGCSNGWSKRRPSSIV